MLEHNVCMCIVYLGMFEFDIHTVSKLDSTTLPYKYYQLNWEIIKLIKFYNNK